MNLEAKKMKLPAATMAIALIATPALAVTYDWTASLRGQTTVFGGAVTVDDSVIQRGSLLLGRRCQTANDCQSVGDWEHVSFNIPPILADALSGRGANTDDLITANFDAAGNVTAASVSLSADEGFPGLVSLLVTGFGPDLTGTFTESGTGPQPYSLTWMQSGQPSHVPEPNTLALVLGIGTLWAVTLWRSVGWRGRHSLERRPRIG